MSHPSTGTPAPRRRAIAAILLPAAGAFLTVFAALSLSDTTGAILWMAPFGASCVLAFALPESPLAQPRNIVGGHLLSTAVGLALLYTAGPHPWSGALGVALAILLMQATRTVHPPAGADPLVVLAGGFGWTYLAMPALAGSLLIVAAAWGFHRLSGRAYPQRWL